MRCQKCKREQKTLKKGLIVFEGQTTRPTTIRVCEGCGWPVFDNDKIRKKED